MITVAVQKNSDGSAPKFRSQTHWDILVSLCESKSQHWIFHLFLTLSLPEAINE